MYPWCPDCEGRGALPCTVCVGGHADCERCEGTDMETCALCERLSALFSGERVRDVVAMAKELVSLRHDAKARRLVVTTGGTYLGSVDFDAALRQLEIERDEARAEAARLKDERDNACAALNAGLPSVRELLLARDEARAEAERLRNALAAIALDEYESLHLSVEAARREGAEAMREAAAQWVADFCASGKAQSIRALPLPGEEKP